jgi:hypothetical protein
MAMNLSTLLPWLLSGEFSPGNRIRLIECGAKCRYLMKVTCTGTLRQLFYLPEAPSTPMATYCPLPLHTVYVYTVYIFTQGRGGELTRARLEGKKVHKAGRKY